MLEVFPALMQGFIETIGAKVGWAISVTTGGPDPTKKDGQIRVMSFHYGHTPAPDKLTFSKWDPDHKDRNGKLFSRFVHQIFREFYVC